MTPVRRAEGYHQRFGLVHVDFTTQSRTPRACYTQVWMPDGSPVNLLALAAQLEQLRLALKTEAVTLEHDTAVGAVAQAEVATQQGDETGALAHLKAAGAWALGIARKIGVEVAALAIAHAIAGG